MYHTLFACIMCRLNTLNVKFDTRKISLFETMVSDSHVHKGLKNYWSMAYGYVRKLINMAGWLTCFMASWPKHVHGCNFWLTDWFVVLRYNIRTQLGENLQIFYRKQNEYQC